MRRCSSNFCGLGRYCGGVSLSIGILIIALPFIQDLVAQRGEKLELLIDKTENLVDSVSSEDGGVNSLGLPLS